ncbi:TIGR01457 family HAD-type hydrolase [Weissella paramesenteroides]|jgi:4-nitrophenyl phosphatase|uniref:TIGR01457 family HAD-type hydrolase n=1 Tax=Weissella paramesenteroides TaxID=1249 RepID=UPI002E7B8D7C|nr:TIGR01457 family HAD-type hydrolase [Weissella paramesenteroides]WPQ67552.1 TIGR01457 family HAD-type hydrolase [Weissella paramesenteroides]
MATHYDGYLIDLDGTIYQGTKQFPSGRRFINRLAASQTKYLFVTNNSTKTPEAVAENLTNNHQIPTTPDQVYTSAMALADYLEKFDQIHRVLMIGEEGLEQALLAKGFELVTEAPADAVAIGLDRAVTYEKILQGTLAIQQGAMFVATNPDTNLPTERGMVPGAGSVVAFLATAVRPAPIVIGKPEHIIMDGALDKLQIKRHEAIMVGDNYNTDIKAGLSADIDTLLVYSGVSKKDDVLKQAKQPTHWVDSLDDWTIEK